MVPNIKIVRFTALERRITMQKRRGYILGMSPFFIADIIATMVFGTGIYLNNFRGVWWGVLLIGFGIWLGISSAIAYKGRNKQWWGW